MSISKSLKAFIPIKWKEATHLIHTYHNSEKPKLTRQVTVNGSTIDETISGFSICKSDLIPLFEDDKVERIFIAIGYHDGHIPNRNNESIGHSGIFFGMDGEDKLLIHDSYRIANYSKPCPPKCPKFPDGNEIRFDEIEPLPLD